jgi:hypothetical protein
VSAAPYVLVVGGPRDAAALTGLVDATHLRPGSDTLVVFALCSGDAVAAGALRVVGAQAQLLALRSRSPGRGFASGVLHELALAAGHRGAQTIACPAPPGGAGARWLARRGFARADGAGRFEAPTEVVVDRLRAAMRAARGVA